MMVQPFSRALRPTWITACCRVVTSRLTSACDQALTSASSITRPGPEIRRRPFPCRPGPMSTPRRSRYGALVSQPRARAAVCFHCISCAITRQRTTIGAESSVNHQGREGQMAKTLDQSKLRSRHRNAYVALYIVGGLTLLLGLTAELGRVEALLQLFGSGWVVAVEGLILLVLGYFTMRGSLLALAIAMGIYGIDAILTLVAGGFQGIWLRALG